MSLDLQQLKSVAEKATPGNWYSDNDGDVWTDAEKEYCPGMEQEIFRVFGSTKCGPDRGDAAFIAALNPRTALALITLVECYEEALRKCAKPSTWHVPCIRCSEKIIEDGNYIAREALSRGEQIKRGGE